MEFVADISIEIHSLVARFRENAAIHVINHDN